VDALLRFSELRPHPIRIDDRSSVARRAEKSFRRECSCRPRNSPGRTMNRFLRYVLPVLVVVVLVIVAVFVFNAFEVSHLMETEKRAGPTLLNP
jgi:Flp pilus assembly protein TadB